MTRQAMVVSRKMDTPTAVVAMLGMASFPPLSKFLFVPSEEDRDRRLKQERDDKHYMCKTQLEEVINL